MEKSSTTLWMAMLAVGAGNAQAQDFRSGTADALQLAGAWVDGTVPTTADIATWGSGSSPTNVLGAGQTYGGLRLNGVSGPVSVTGAFNLTLDHATDANTVFDVGTHDFSWGAAGAGGQFNIIGAVSTVAPGNGNTNTGASFLGSGTVTLSGTGTKNWSTSGSATNGGNGVTQLGFTGTLRLRGATTAIETLGGNWLAFGGGGGTTEVPGSLVQTGAFHLDTGDEASRGDFILTQAINGQSLRLSSLRGTGNIRSDWGVGAALSERGLSIEQDIDTVFAGGIYMHNGSGQRRNVTVTKSGGGTLTFIGRLGSSGGTANLNFDIQDGVWQMGDGTENPSPHLNAANWDTASTFTIGSGGTLRFKTNGTEYVWDRVLSGSGVIEVTNDGTEGEGKVVLATANPNFTGTTVVDAGRLRIGGSLEASAVEVRDGATIATGSAATPATIPVKTLSLEAGSRSQLRAGTVHDEIQVLEANGFSVSGEHVIEVEYTGGLNPGDRVPVIDYEGSFGGAAFLSLAEGSRFAIYDNVEQSRVELEYTGGTLTWLGGTGVWDFDQSANWDLGGNFDTFRSGDAVKFDDSADSDLVELVGTLNPSGVTFDHEVRMYRLQGGLLGGSGSIIKRGSAEATIVSPTDYTGETLVEEGTLRFGDGGTSGEIGRGRVFVGSGATLRISRSDLLDYKTSARMRRVEGSGDVVVDGGGILFNYPGTGLAFAETGSWAGFSGRLIVVNGSEFRTIRNGATAMGTGTVVLGDETSSGKLAPIEGNWTWTNPIQVVGADNRIVNRSEGAGRLMKLQGVISGEGGLTFEDAAGTMTQLQTGVILTGANDFSGILTIAAGVPVRVGGVPGNADTNQSGPGAAGSLGTATVVNQGLLTFSRTDAHAVENPISGSGSVVVGLTSGTGGQEVTLSGEKTYTGTTTVRNGSLKLETALVASKVVVEAAGVLKGSGEASAGMDVFGEVSPGDGVGVLTAGGTSVWKPGSKLRWQVSDWNGAGGFGADLLQLSSMTVEATVENPLVIVVSPESLSGFEEVEKSFTVLTAAAGISGLDSGEVVVDDSAFPGFGNWSVVVQGGSLELHYVPGGDPYLAWEIENGIEGAGMETDSDGDGIANGIEFVIGGDPSGPNSNSRHLLPTGRIEGNEWWFEFRRADVAAGLNPAVEYGSTLTGWTEAEPGVSGVTIEEHDDFHGPGIDRVRVRIPRNLAVGGKLFARLKVDPS